MLDYECNVFCGLQEMMVPAHHLKSLPKRSVSRGLWMVDGPCAAEAAMLAAERSATGSMHGIQEL